LIADVELVWGIHMRIPLRKEIAVVRILLESSEADLLYLLSATFRAWIKFPPFVAILQG
jgi:hypothetical protein